MKKQVALHQIIPSLYYVFAALMLFALVDIVLYFILRGFLFSALSSFNDLQLFWKLAVLIIGGLTISIGLLNLMSGLARSVRRLALTKRSSNYYAVVGSSILALTNLIYCLYLLWKNSMHINLWMISELILLFFIFCSFLAIVLYSFIVLLVPQKIRTSGSHAGPERH